MLLPEAIQNRKLPKQTRSIEAGNATSGMVIVGGALGQAPGSKSPYGLWGSLGTRASKETISSDF